MARHNPDITDEFRSLRRPLRLTLAGMWLERILAAFWPLLSLVGISVGVMLLADAGAWPRETRLLAAGTVALLGLIGLALGLVRFRIPKKKIALARMDANVPGQPIAALQDRLVLGHSDQATRRIWRAHLDRMQDRLSAVRPVWPDPDLRKRDPLALRFLALLALTMGLVFGSWQKLADNSVLLASPAAVEGTGPSWEGWVEPPSYTGKPPLYLADLGEEQISVPIGSTVTIRLYGTRGALVVRETLSGGETLPADDPSQVLELRRSGGLNIEGEGGRSWQFAVVDDALPRINVNGIMETRLNGEWTQPYLAGDDYGVNAGFARIALDLVQVDRRHGLAADPEPRPDIEIELPLPFVADRREIEGVLEEFLVRHPWAGLPVSLTLGARDAALQVGLSEPENMILPARRFFDPLAAGLIEQRRDLLWTRANADRISMILRAIAYDPRGDFRSDTDRERLRSIIRKLESFADADRLSPEFQDELAEALWELAVAVEEGNLSDALERLRRAEERLDQAMRDGATPEEIEQLMNEFREALNDYIRQLAEQSQQDGQQQQSQNGNQDRMEMNGDQLEQLLNRLQELMEQGRMAEAQELMEMLREMMENMQVQQGQGGQQSPGQQAMEGLSETLRDQQGLSDDTFSDLQQGEGQQNGQPGQGGQPGQQGQGEQGNQPGGNGQSMPGGEPGQGQMNPGGSGGGSMPGLADRQEALRQQLEDQLNSLPGQAGEGTRRALDEAGRAMDGAEDALRQGDLPGAMDNQADAMDALREGMQELADQLARDQEGQQGQAAGRGGAPERADPLGREAGNQGQSNTDENLLQGPDVYRRAEELLNELRRRSGDRERTEQERDYLDRLLERF